MSQAPVSHFAAQDVSQLRAQSASQVQLVPQSITVGPVVVPVVPVVPVVVVPVPSSISTPSSDRKTLQPQHIDAARMRALIRMGRV